MNLKKLLLSVLISTAMVLPAIATELGQSEDSALQSYDTLQAKSDSSSKSSGTCWVYFPGFGWIYIC